MAIEPIRFIGTPNPSAPPTPIRESLYKEIINVSTISILPEYPDDYNQKAYNELMSSLASAMLLVSYYRGRNPATRRVQQLHRQMPRVIHMQEEHHINDFNQWLVKKYFSLANPESDKEEFKTQVNQLYQSVNPAGQVSAWLLQLFPNLIKSHKKNNKRAKVNARSYEVRDPNEFPLGICDFYDREADEIDDTDFSIRSISRASVNNIREACVAEHIVYHIIDMFEKFKQRYKTGFFISTNPPMLTLCKKIQASLKKLLDEKFESKDEFKRAIVNAITQNAVIAGIVPKPHLDILDIVRTVKKCINFKNTATMVTESNADANANLSLLPFCAALLSATSYYQNTHLVRPAAGKNSKKRWLKQAKKIEMLVYKTLATYQNNYSQGLILFNDLKNDIDKIRRKIRGRWFYGSGSRLAGSLEKILKSTSVEPHPDLLGPQPRTLPEIIDTSTMTSSQAKHFANQQLLQNIAKKILQYKKVVSKRRFVSTNIQKLERMENIENKVNNLFRSTLERQKIIIGEKTLPEYLLDLVIAGNEESPDHETGFFRSGVYGKVLYEVESYLKEIQPANSRQISERNRHLS
jgi:hypothetical protein